LSESLDIGDKLSLEEKYALLHKQLVSLLTREENLLSNLSNFTAALKQTFEKISWVGFYLNDGQKLYLGPFQGKVACTRIEIGQGVCGTAAEKRRTIIVEDVDKFPGHIACDPESRSEIVIPIIKNEQLIGVLDLDSRDLNSFNSTDQKFLEQYCTFLSSEII
jgi:GAF domain-containing protein